MTPGASNRKDSSVVAHTVRIGDRLIGEGHPTFIAAEIGINHNGSLDLALQLIDAAADAGCDAVKFQKRTPELCVPESQRARIRSTPWGDMTYMEYRHRMEFGAQEFRAIDGRCTERGLVWFASPWDVESVDFLEQFAPVAYKVPSALVTHADVLERVAATSRTIVLSTGMSMLDTVRQAVQLVGADHLLLTHCTSTYPCPPDELNLRVIQTLQAEFDCPVGYSGHEVGLPTTLAAVCLGACYVERHITLDRSMWGSDHAASVEPEGFKRLVRYIRGVEAALGDGVKRVYDSELPIRERLRNVDNLAERLRVK